MAIEQAIFTSARSSRSEGYHLVATSPGVTPDDARELVAWGPTHDSLAAAGVEAAARAGRRPVSVNFFPLPSGAFCVSRTTHAGPEYSGRRGPQVYTQCLVVPADTLARFANNAFRLLEAATAAGHIRVMSNVPQRLDPLVLPGRASPVSLSLLDRLCFHPGARRLAAVLRVALSCRCLGIVGAEKPERLLAGAITLVPPECRTQWSFSTGLKVSAQRPFRLTAVDDDPVQRRMLLEREAASLLDMQGELPDELDLGEGWAALVYQTMSAGNLGQLAALLQQPHPGLQLEQLDGLARGWLAQARSACFGQAPPAEVPDSTAAPAEAAGATHAGPLRAAPRPRQHTHPAHERSAVGLAPRAGAAPRPVINRPAAALDPGCQELMDQLEQIDTCVLEAIRGDYAALDRLRGLWPNVARKLDPGLVQESREQYLQYALSAWLEESGQADMRDASRAVFALDVLTTLFE